MGAPPGPGCPPALHKSTPRSREERGSPAGGEIPRLAPFSQHPRLREAAPGPLGHLTLKSGAPQGFYFSCSPSQQTPKANPLVLGWFGRPHSTPSLSHGHGQPSTQRGAPCPQRGSPRPPGVLGASTVPPLNPKPCPTLGNVTRVGSQPHPTAPCPHRGMPDGGPKIEPWPFGDPRHSPPAPAPHPPASGPAAAMGLFLGYDTQICGPVPHPACPGTKIPISNPKTPPVWAVPGATLPTPGRDASGEYGVGATHPGHITTPSPSQGQECPFLADFTPKTAPAPHSALSLPTVGLRATGGVGGQRGTGPDPITWQSPGHPYPGTFGELHAPRLC